VAERHLREDGTEADLSPPPPFSTRMWVGGSVRWERERPLIAGMRATSISEVVQVETKGHEKGRPMLFVTQGIKYISRDQSEPSITEERTHIYLHSSLSSQDRKVMNRPVKDLPQPSQIEFSLEYTPTPITLFRYSALTFNAHSIHLDKEYCQREGYPGQISIPLSFNNLIHTLQNDSYMVHLWLKCCWRPSTPGGPQNSDPSRIVPQTP